MIRARLAEERGIALVVAMMVILLIGIFSAVIAQSALDVNETSTRDRDSKRALAAAETGINAAFARINRTAGLTDSRCLADAPVEVEGTLTGYDRLNGTVTIGAGECRPSPTERAGNAEFFHYHVSPVLSSSANGCNDPFGVAASAGRSSLLASGLVVLERCVTAVGTVNGVHRRVQRRAFSTLQLFSGVTADERFQATAGADLGGTRIQANGAVSMNAVTFAGEIVRYRGAPEPSMENVTGAWTTTTRDRPFPLAPVDPEPKEGSANAMSCTGPPLDLLCASDPYDATNKTLRIPSGYTVTLSGGDYYLCELTVDGGGTLSVSADSNVYVDDRDRAGHNCGASSTASGTVTLKGAVNPAGALTAAGVAGRLRIFVYGDADAPAVTIAGTATTIVNGLVYAPQSHVNVTKDEGAAAGPILTGAISARQVAVSGTLTTVTGLLDLPIPADGLAVPTLYDAGDWVECERVADDGKPHSNCRGL